MKNCIVKWILAAAISAALSTCVPPGLCDVVHATEPTQTAAGASESAGEGLTQTGTENSSEAAAGASTSAATQNEGADNTSAAQDSAAATGNNSSDTQQANASNAVPSGQTSTDENLSPGTQAAADATATDTAQSLSNTPNSSQEQQESLNSSKTEALTDQNSNSNSVPSSNKVVQLAADGSPAVSQTADTASGTEAANTTDADKAKSEAGTSDGAAQTASDGQKTDAANGSAAAQTGASDGTKTDAAGNPANTSPTDAAKTEEGKAGLNESIEIDGVKVTVTADEGVFPEGATVDVRKVMEAEAEEIEEAVDKVREEGKTVAASYTFDITVRDKDGNEIEPDTTKGKVKVTFALAEAEREDLEADIYHIEGETGEASSEELTAEKLDTETTENEVTAETEGFSYYTVEFTFAKLQYVMNGDTTVLLSDILATLNITGTVTNVSVSNPALLGVTCEEGVWKITALQAFTTTEWMKVTAGGKEYEIEVTDDQGTTCEVKYLKEGATLTATCKKVGPSITLTDGWYVVDDNTYSDNFKISGTVNLILCDGKTLHVSDGIILNYGSTLNIYCQEGKTGKLISTGANYQAGIGSYSNSTATWSWGSLNIYGGVIEANGGKRAAGIGGARYSTSIQSSNLTDFGTITIYDGTVTARCGEGDYAAGIGGANGCAGGRITILGGTVKAYGGKYAAGIGSGAYSEKRETTINIDGGDITAEGGTGIGTGMSGDNLTINISGGTITATGNGYGPGIGGTRGKTNINISGGNITASAEGGPGIGDVSQNRVLEIKITGGTITATGGYNAAGIGGRYSIIACDISGNCDITATGGVGAAGIGGGNGSYCEKINISGGTISATGGDGAAGIGDGSDNSVYNKAASNITIEGSVNYLIATGGGAGAGIGGGYKNPRKSNITIKCNEDSYIFASGGAKAAAIGNGAESTGGSETNISGGTLFLYAGEGASSIGRSVGETKSGDITLTNRMVYGGADLTNNQYIPVETFKNTPTRFAIIEKLVGSDIYLNKVRLSLTANGTSEQLTLTGGTLNKWESSNPAVATVDNTGLVTPHTAGKAVITAVVTNVTGDEVRLTCEVTVSSAASESATATDNIVLSPTSQTIKKGKSFNITATPDISAASKDYFWSTSNSAVATVNSKGVVYGVGYGTATIKLTRITDNKTATCTVTVTAEAITDVKLERESINLAKGTQKLLGLTITPSRSDSKTITWSSNNPAVATVDENGLVTTGTIDADGNIIPGATGEAVISVTVTDYYNKQITKSCTVTVTEKPIPVESISTMDKELEIEEGDWDYIFIDYSPYEATYPDLEFSSSDESVATVDETGIVEAKKVGTAIITVKVTGTNLSDTCKITVTPKPNSDSGNSSSGGSSSGSSSSGGSSGGPSIITIGNGGSGTSTTPGTAAQTQTQTPAAPSTITAQPRQTTETQVPFGYWRERKYGEGTIRIAVLSQDNSGNKYGSGALAGDTNYLLSIAFTKEELLAIQNGASAELLLSATDEAASITMDDREKIKADFPDLAVVRFFDLTLRKRIGTSGDWQKISEPAGAATITMDIPDHLRVPGRQFTILRSHNGTVEQLQDLDNDDNSITFATDRFSVYALAYKDNAAGVTAASPKAVGAAANGASAPKMGDLEASASEAPSKGCFALASKYLTYKVGAIVLMLIAGIAAMVFVAATLQSVTEASERNVC